MAWDHNARNRSAEVRRVNYHEDGPSRRSSSGSSGGNDGGGLGPVGKVIVGGLALYIAGSIGLGWIEDIKDGIDTAMEVREYEKTKKKDSKESAKAEKKNNKELNDQGYTERFDVDVDGDEFPLEPGDVRDIIVKLEEQVEVYNADVSTESLIYVSPLVFDNSSNYTTAITNRLKVMEETPVTFVAVYDDIGSKKLEKEYEHMVDIVNINAANYNGPYTSTDIRAYLGFPDQDSMTVAVTYSYDKVEEDTEEIVEE